VIYKVLIQPAAFQMLQGIGDRRVQSKILERIEQLTMDPEKRGKPLTDELKGFWSLRAVGHRYRIIYRIERGRIEVIVISIGLRREGDRKDAYEIALKLVRAHLV
jgi:mRNA interferase RelE/StbE